MLHRRYLIVFLAAFLMTLALYPAAAQDTAFWQAADTIRSLGFQAQVELLSSDGSASQIANDLITQARETYAASLQPSFASGAPDADALIIAALDAAQTAAVEGNSVMLAAARGRWATGILWGSYAMTLASVEADNIPAARAWLQLREFRQPTRVTLVTNEAANVLEKLEAGEIKAASALVEVSDDLREAYFYRGREALNRLDEAIRKEMATSAAEAAGLARGYFALLQQDYTVKLGEDAANSLQAALIDLETVTMAGDWNQAQVALGDIQPMLVVYQPVKLTSAEISERGSLLFMFTDLVNTEYRNGVNNGTITIPIEYQEAVTFLDQAQSIYEDLQGEAAAVDGEAAQRLGAILASLDTLIADIGPRDDVTALVTEAKTLIQGLFDINATATNATAAFPIIDTLLDSMVDAVRAGNYAEAEQTRLEAYAIFDFGPEPRLVAFAPDLMAEVEGLFWQGNGDQPGLAAALANDAPIEDILTIRSALDEALAAARVVIGDSSSEPLAVMFNAAIIVFREGLEAIVILAALIAGMVGAYQRYRRPLIAGAFVALLASGATWFLAQGILDIFRAYGEKLEAVVSIIAIGVLLLITNWFFHKVYWTQWIANFHKQKRSLLGREVEIGQMLGLAVLGFTSVYREGFETVLFLQALVLDVGALTVIQGVLLGGIAVGLVGLLTFRLQRRLPYRRMLVWTGILIGGVLLVIMGHTIHVMQVVGWMPITPIQGVILPSWLGVWLGIFATWQGIIAQIAAAAFVIGSYYLAQHQASKKRQDNVGAHSTQVSQSS